ncbi:hypothetical protein RCJ22_01905, partial [Vibrio sp. FNV 38]|nr:hypothetical protein [Vibrio sp. FNV 38]
MMACSRKACPYTSNYDSNVSPSFTVTMCLAVAVWLIFSIEIATKFLALIFIHLRCQAKIIDIGHGISASKGIKVWAVYISCRVRADPSSDFRIVITLAKANEPNLFIDSLATVSPGISNGRVRNYPS